MNGDSGSDDSEGSPRVETAELLYEIAEEELVRQSDHFHRIEEKVWRHAALLGILAGGFTVSLPAALNQLQSDGTAVVCLFGVAYFLLAADLLSGLWCFAMAMRYDVLGVGVFREGFLERYREVSYPDLVEVLSESAEEWIEKNQSKFDEKVPWAKRGWVCLVASVPLAGTSLLLYVLSVLT